MGKKTLINVSQKGVHLEATVPAIGASVVAESLDDVLLNAEREIVRSEIAAKKRKEARRKTQQAKAS